MSKADGGRRGVLQGMAQLTGLPLWAAYIRGEAAQRRVAAHLFTSPRSI